MNAVREGSGRSVARDNWLYRAYPLYFTPVALLSRCSRNSLTLLHFSACGPLSGRTASRPIGS